MEHRAETTESEREQFLRQLSERYRQPLTAYFQRRVRSRNEAEDLTQEVFLRLVRRLDVEAHRQSGGFRVPDCGESAARPLAARQDAAAVTWPS